jgi:hypothetical protein
MYLINVFYKNYEKLLQLVYHRIYELVVLNRIEAFEATYFPISGKDCEVFLMNERADYSEEIYGKKIFDLDFVAYLSEWREEPVIMLLDRSIFAYKLLWNSKILNNYEEQVDKITIELKKKSGEYFELLKNTENYKEKCIKIGNLFEYLDQDTINQLFEIIRK